MDLVGIFFDFVGGLVDPYFGLQYPVTAVGLIALFGIAFQSIGSLAWWLRLRLARSEPGRRWSMRLGCAMRRRIGEVGIVQFDDEPVPRGGIADAQAAIGSRLSPPHLSKRRLVGRCRRILAVDRELGRLVVVATWLADWAPVIATAALLWARPPWQVLPTTWWAPMKDAYRTAITIPLPVYLTAATLVIALLVFVSRGGIVDHLRFREEATRTTARLFNDLLAAFTDLRYLLMLVQDRWLNEQQRFGDVDHAVTRATGGALAWTRNGQLQEIPKVARGLRLQRVRTDIALNITDDMMSRAIERVEQAQFEITASGLHKTVRRILFPVYMEAAALGILSRRVAGPDRPGSYEWAKAATLESRQRSRNALLDGLRDLWMGDDTDDSDLAAMYDICWDAAHDRDKHAVDLTVHMHHIKTVCRRIERLQGDLGFGTRLMLALKG